MDKRSIDYAIRKFHTAMEIIVSTRGGYADESRVRRGAIQLLEKSFPYEMENIRPAIIVPGTVPAAKPSKKPSKAKK